MTRRHLVSGLLAAVAAMAVGNAARAENVDLAAIRATVIAGLARRAEAHGASAEQVLRVASCETGGTFSPWRADGSLLRGSHGELGVGQWLAGGAWYGTPHYREYGYDIRAAYTSGDPEAIDWDIDALAWAFSPLAPAGFARQWSCP